MTKFNEMQTVKRRFFAMRNGAVADNMRRHGASYRIIFGLNLPQIVEIAAETPHSVDLAESLVTSTVAMERYVALRLMFNLLPAHLDDIKELAKSELDKNEPMTAFICRQLIDEIDFLKEEI